MKDNPAGTFGSHCSQGRVAHSFPGRHSPRKRARDKGELHELCALGNDSVSQDSSQRGASSLSSVMMLFSFSLITKAGVRHHI